MHIKEIKNMNEAINMRMAKEKLMDLSIENDTDNLIKVFGQFLSPRLNDELVAVGFVLGCDLALYDLSNGIDGYTEERIQNRLVGSPNIIYTSIKTRVPDIAKAIFPSEFADEVSEICKET
jgi:hypothetical protein